jgi:hypothetical protein
MKLLLRGIAAAGWLLAMIVAAGAGPLNGTLISAVNSNAARYAPGLPGSSVLIFVTLTPTSDSYAGHLDWVVCSRTVALANGSVSGLSVASGASVTATIDLPALPTTDHTGYMVFLGAYATADSGTVGCTGNTGSPLDTASRGVDISSTVSKFPRGGWISQFYLGWNELNNVQWLNQYNIDYIIHYDVDCRAHTPYCSGATWTDLEGETVYGASVTAALTAEHQYGMAGYLFEDVGLADAGYANQGAQLQWGLFNETGGSPQCLTITCSTANQSSFGRFPSTWRTTSYYLMNEGNALWQNYIFGNIKQGIAAYAYDGFQADTIGAPVTQLFDYYGNPVNVGAALADYTNNAYGIIGKPTVVNAVSMWNAQDIATRSSEPWFFAEMHPEFGDYPTFVGPQTMALLLRQWTSKEPVMPAYVDQAFAASLYACAPPGSSYRQSFINPLTLSASCYVNTPGAILAQNAFLAAGIDHLELGDYDPNCGAPKFAAGEFWKGPMPCMKPALQNALYSLAQMETGYENLYLDAAALGQESITITGGGTGSAAAGAGKIFVQAKWKPGFEFYDFINLTAVNTANSSAGIALYQDNNGTMPQPSALSGVTVTATYYGTITPGTSKLYAISAETNGQPKLLSYTASGGSISFTLPDFTYAIRVVLETNALIPGITGAYTFDGTQAWRGEGYNDATPGCGTPAGTVAVQGSGGCYAHYIGVSFGSTPLTTIKLTASAANPATLEVRVDYPSGPPLAAATLPSSTTTTTLPFHRAASGVHDLYLTFTDRVAAVTALQLR